MKIKPKNVLIIGGGSGIGYAAAQKLLDYGVPAVILASRDESKLKNAKEKLKYSEKQKVYCASFDIAQVQKQEERLREIQRQVSAPIDGLIISSGKNFDGSNWKGFNISEADWDMVMDTNLKGVFFLIRNFSNWLYSNQIKGNICVVSSISARRDLLSVYQVSKNAISGIVHAYGKYLCERGIVLNCVEPGVTDTPMMSYLKEYTDGIRPGKAFTSTSVGRLLRAEEIAETICFLMSEVSEVMSGTCLLASGGNKELFP